MATAGIRGPGTRKSMGVGEKINPEGAQKRQQKIPSKTIQKTRNVGIDYTRKNKKRHHHPNKGGTAAEKEETTGRTRKKISKKGSSRTY